MKNIHVFTSSALNYLPKARMLFHSLRKHHPEFVLHLALADEPRDLIHIESEPFDDIMPIADLGIPNWKPWAFCHDIVELCTAIKPFVLRKLLDLEDCSKVLYLDPDMVVFSRLDDILSALDEANIVLTPHQITPETSLRAIIDNEICSLRTGVYNLGFIGVTANSEGMRFADWWSSRLYHFCRDEVMHGLFTDQRWIDLVPAFFEDVGIIKSSRHNVATWNVTTRKFSGSLADGFQVDSQPLGFYHFTGFDKGDHEYMVTKVAGENESLRSLLKWYVHSTRQSSHDPLAKVTWAFGAFSNGETVSKAQRLIYRERPDLQASIADPFDSHHEPGYLTWWRQKAPKKYPELFAKDQSEVILQKICMTLTPGYRGFQEKLDWQTLSRHFKSAIKSPEYGAALIKRSAAVIKRHGVAGFLTKIKKF